MYLLVTKCCPVGSVDNSLNYISVGVSSVLPVNVQSRCSITKHYWGAALPNWLGGQFQLVLVECGELLFSVSLSTHWGVVEDSQVTECVGRQHCARLAKLS